MYKRYFCNAVYGRKLTLAVPVAAGFRMIYLVMVLSTTSQTFRSAGLSIARAA